MCLTVILAVLLVLLLLVFMKSAVLLAPWTMTAAILAVVSGIGLGKLVSRSKGSGAVVCVVSTLMLTFAFGYLGYWLLPPTAPPSKPGLQGLVEGPEPTQGDLWQMFPVHLAIVSIIGAIVVSGVWYLGAADLKPRQPHNAAEPNATPDGGQE
jgi:hypothetical protein